MGGSLTFGNEILVLDEVTSTNSYAQDLATTTNLIEGFVVKAKTQTKGKGQRGNVWETEPHKNLTFSLVLKPNLAVNEQFMLSKTIALGLFDFLTALKLKNVAIKWPNDILVNGKKIAGILIENTLKQNKIGMAIVGIGLNVNQTQFANDIKATSLVNELGVEPEIKETLSNLLIYLEKRYLQLRALNYNVLNTDYTSHLLGYQTELTYQVEDRIVKGKIVGISNLGKLQLQINNAVEEFGMQEIKLVINNLF